MVFFTLPFMQTIVFGSAFFGELDGAAVDGTEADGEGAGAAC